MYKLYSVILICLSILLPNLLIAQDEVPTAFNIASIQPRQNALGGCSVNLVDGNSFFSNPGAMGVYYLNHNLYTSMPYGVEYPLDMFPDRYASNDKDSWDFSIGFNTRQFLSKECFKPNVSISFGYMKINGESYEVSTWIENDEVTKGEIFRNSTNRLFAFAVAIDFYLRLSIGFTRDSPEYVFRQRFSEFYKEGNDIKRFGLYADLPIELAIFTKPESKKERVSSVWITPSVGYVHSYAKSDIISFRNEEAYIGIGLHLDYREANLTQYSLSILLEYDKPDNGHIYYTYNFGGPGLRADYPWRRKFGLEFSFIDAIFIRFGMIENIDDPTYGFGLSTRGILRNLFHLKLSRKNNVINYILNNIDVRYDIGRSNIIFPSDWETYHRISLTI